MDDPLSAWFLRYGFRDAVVDRKGDGLTETGAAVLVVVLVPAFLGVVPFGCVWEGGREAFARSTARFG
jgi:hypothetical protein